MNGQNQRGRGCGAYRAFTVAELVVVLAVIGVATSIAIPRYANFLAFRRVESAARRVVADLALAQRQARFSSTSQTVDFDAIGHKYTLVGMQHPDIPNAGYEVRLSEEPYLATIVTADFGGDAEIIFDIYGRPDSGGFAVLDVSPYRVSISVDPDSGRATVTSVQEIGGDVIDFDPIPK